MDKEKVNMLVTGGSGFLGTALIDKLLDRRIRVISISRHPPEMRENMVPLVGDITEPNLGLNDSILYDVSGGHIDSLFHLAAIHTLGEDRDGSIWRTNVEGTRNVINFCTRHQILHLFFCSSAYTGGRNTYERSKAVGELIVTRSDIPETTIFKPSIVLGSQQHFYPGHFAQFVQLMIKIHQRAEIVRRKVEGTLRLPVIEPTFRLKGNPEGRLNMVVVDDVAQTMATIGEEGMEGIYWLTNPNPPTLTELADWIGELIMVKLKIERDFKATPIEAAFQKMAAAFQPYLEGDNFPSNMPCPRISQEFIQETILQTIFK